RVLSSLSHARETENDQASLLNALGRLWLAGSAVDWRGFYSHERRHRLPLPTYPFDRKRYWIEPAAGQADAHQVQRNGSRGLAEDPPAQETKKQEAGKPRFDPTQFDQRENQTLSELKAVFQELSGVDLSHADTSAKFLELGFDSLFLTQASQAVQKRFGANVTFRQLLEEVTTLEKLAAHLDGQKPEAARRNGSRQTADPPRAEPRLKPAIVRPAESEAADVKTIPLTDAQREIWFATQLGPAVSTAYNESCTLRLHGPLQLEALQRAVQQLVERHEALRTTFSPSGAFQRIAATARMEAPLVDFSDLDERNHEACVNDLIGREIQHEFDLVNGPLLRAQIVRLAPDHHRLVFTAHHLICDGWSMSVLLYELGELYSANCRGGSCALPAPMPFSGYAQSEAEEQQSPESAAAEAYWVKQFSDSVPVLELPGDRPRPATRTYSGSHQVRSLQPGLAAAVKRFSAERNCTTFTTLLAVFNALVHRLSGQDDVVIGAPAAGQIMGG